MSHRQAAFHSQCQWTRILLSLTTPMAMGTKLGFKRHRKSHYLSQCSRKLWFQRNYQWIFLQVALLLWVLEVHINGIRGVTIHITESKIKKSWFDTNVGLLLFLHVSPFQPSSISFLRVHLNGIKGAIVHLSVHENYGFGTIISEYFYRYGLEVHINVITGITIHITESKIKKSWFDTNVGLLLFLYVTLFQAKRTFKWHWKCCYSSQCREKLWISY